jgi:uncharacterized membrane protein YcaP (DUF421 family)
VYWLQVPPWEIPIRTAVIYGALLVMLRLAGKREIGQLTVFDLVLLLLISNAVQNAMVGSDNSILGGLSAAAVLIVLNMAVARLRLRSVRLRRLVEGSPTVLVLHGAVQDANMRREGMDEDVLEAAMREHGFGSLNDVDMAVLETDGSISFVPVGQETRRTKRLRKLIKHA